ncbi:RrF2 family transcriptional regulator [Cellvibrio polysaccharolyticus]|uniref:Rrf2 family transcriptional regulator n=1 Tax=Cellvibrio polysaccharolyticus TaxID=2082724 RepID=A0A928V3T8_9GAMM|nr:Rrf2 family transcriptional regulator [Cellvibrio polysaccharolyticus]MBE8718253.1 Rrf2 family transcriptional regulator [Cellvibrio polysaccharolyticus]
MRITSYTDYSLRVLMYLALKGDEQATIREIADSYDISKNHLMKVVQDLNSKGYLIALRGKNGGIRLNGDPENINIGVLVRDMEQDLALVECFGGDNTCIITPACHLKKILAEALEAFFRSLDGYSLADLLPGSKRKALIRLLDM